MTREPMPASATELRRFACDFKIPGEYMPMFVIGNNVAPGLHGTYPSLEDLDENGDLKFSTVFRDVYAAILKDHLGIDPAPVLAGSYTPVQVIRA